MSLGFGAKIVLSSSKTIIWGPKSLRRRGLGMSWSALPEANEVSQKMCRLDVGQHQACSAKWVGKQ